MKTIIRSILLSAPVLLALAAAVLIAHAGTSPVHAGSTPRPAMMSIPF